MPREKIEEFLDQLAPHVSAVGHERCFVHNDVHEMNVMCTRAGDLLAIIDWGDAGWGDPVLDFVAVPLEMMSAVVRWIRRRQSNEARRVPRSADHLDETARCNG